MVAGQQVYRDTDGAHRLQRLADDRGRKLVGVKDVAGDDDELGGGLISQGAQRGDRITPGRGIAGLGVRGEEVPGHAQLPVRRVQETHVDLPSMWPSRCWRECMTGV